MTGNIITTIMRGVVLSTLKVLVVLVLLYVVTIGGCTTVTELDLYTGASRTRLGVAMLTMPIPNPAKPAHTHWAMKHIKDRSARRWVYVSSRHLSLLGVSHGDGFPINVVYYIFQSDYSENEKVKLLREYYATLDGLSEEANIFELVYVPWKKRFVPGYARERAFIDASRGSESEVKDAVPILIEALEDESRSDRERAARALGNMGRIAEDAVPSLTNALGDGSVDVRRYAARALGNIGPTAEGAVPPLIELLGDEDVRVRMNAVEAVGRIGPASREVVTGLIATLADYEWSVRAHAAKILGLMDAAAKDAIPALAKALEDEDPLVRNSAQEALERIQQAIEEEI